MPNTLSLSEWGPAHLRPGAQHEYEFEERPEDN